MNLLVDDEKGDLVCSMLGCVGVVDTGLVACCEAVLLVLCRVSIAGVGEWLYVGVLGSFSSVSVVRSSAASSAIVIER